MRYLRKEERKEKNQRTKQTKGKQENERNRTNAVVGATGQQAHAEKESFLVTQPVKAYHLNYYRICQMGSA